MLEGLIPPQSGCSFTLKSGAFLRVEDKDGEQVADFTCFNLNDPNESLSGGCTIDYNETIYLSRGHKLFSNRGRVMLEIVEDTVGQHDILLAPCSPAMFELIGKDKGHRNCKDNLIASLKKYDIHPDRILSTFNIFMNVAIDNGKVCIFPPKSKGGDYVVLRAKMDLIVGLTACSDEQTNNGSLKPIQFVVNEQVFP